MLEWLKFLPHLSAATIALFSVFHVGYFSKIGLHLLGLVDVTNLVYSFGITFGFVGIFLILFNGDTFNWLKRISEDDFFFPSLVTAFNRAVLPIILTPFVGFVVYAFWIGKPARIEAAVTCAVFFVLFAWLVVIIYVRHLKEDRIHAVEVAGAVIFLFWSTYEAGKATALNDIEWSVPSYRITLVERSTLQNVKLLRSSSSGFIVAVNGLVQFIPASQVRSVVAETPPR